MQYASLSFFYNDKSILNNDKDDKKFSKCLASESTWLKRQTNFNYSFLL